eukprot:scaffold73837_cov69-Phaeocystis_antarctica.AAC.5
MTEGCCRSATDSANLPSSSNSSCAACRPSSVETTCGSNNKSAVLSAATAPTSPTVYDPPMAASASALPLAASAAGKSSWGPRRITHMISASNEPASSWRPNRNAYRATAKEASGRASHATSAVMARSMAKRSKLVLSVIASRSAQRNRSRRNVSLLSASSSVA